MSAAYEEVKGRAICAAIRLGLLVTGTGAMFPAGAWLMLEGTEAMRWGGALLCAAAGLMASGIPQELARAERLTREAERLRGQEEEEIKH